MFKKKNPKTKTKKKHPQKNPTQQTRNPSIIAVYSLLDYFVGPMATCLFFLLLLVETRPSDCDLSLLLLVLQLTGFLPDNKTP